MALIFNGTTVETITYNGVALDSLTYNGTTVWEGWVLTTGNLYIMTSNTTPSPFSCEGYATGSPSDTDYWRGFDNSYSNDVQYFTGTGGYWQVNLDDFYKIVTASIKFKSATTGTLKLQGKNSSGVWVDLWSQSVSATTTTYSVSADDTIEVEALRVYWSGSSNFHALYECQVTEWYQKGS